MIYYQSRGGIVVVCSLDDHIHSHALKRYLESRSQTQLFFPQRSRELIAAGLDYRRNVRQMLEVCLI